eukprot:7227470-Pyramimonas_sp.AAC.1
MAARSIAAHIFNISVHRGIIILISVCIHRLCPSMGVAPPLYPPPCRPLGLARPVLAVSLRRAPAPARPDPVVGPAPFLQAPGSE